jgi:signal transduction histidine kinase
VQESLTNIVKHAQARTVDLHLCVNEAELVLEINDDGIGPPTRTAVRSSGHQGIVGMRYRMQAVGGTFEIGDATPCGTRIVVHLPLLPDGTALAVQQLDQCRDALELGTLVEEKSRP